MEAEMNWFEKLINSIKKRLNPKPKPEPVPPTPEPPKPEPTKPDPIAPSPMPNPDKPADYRRGFLWKPIGDGGRPAVCLLPSSFTNNTDKRMVMMRGGTVLETSSRAHGDGEQPNGNREHYRWRQQGQNYQGPIDVSVKTKDGVTWTWRVSNPAIRNDGVITPTASR
jgi:hypothetical protein